MRCPAWSAAPTAAPPVEGAANQALIAFVAEVLQLRKSAITIRSGEIARLKLLHLSSDPVAIMVRLADWIGSADTTCNDK